jgi:hypothetical protein
MKKSDLSFRHSSIILYVMFLMSVSALSQLLNVSFSMGNDMQIYSDLANDPMAPLLGNSDYTQYPILIGFLLSPIQLFEIFGISPEICLQVYFSILGLVACAAIDKLTSLYAPVRKLVLTGTVIPWIFLMCYVFVQEDIFGVLLILAAILAIRKVKPIITLIILSLAIVFAKLFFGLLLFSTLILVCRNQKRIAIPLLASSPGLAFLAVSTVNNLLNGKPGFWEFELPTSLSINAWSIVSGDVNIFGVVSWTRISLLSVVFAILVTIWRFRKLEFEAEQIIHYWLTLGLILLVLLYQIQPEYLFLALPCISLSKFDNKEFASILVLFPVAVSQNVLYGFANINQVYNSTEKAQTLNHVISYLPYLKNPQIYQMVAVIFSICSLAALIVTIKRSSFKRTRRRASVE